jgi:hypothetical protein
VALPDVVAVYGRQKPRELALVEDVGQGLTLLRRSDHERRVTPIASFSTRKRKNPLRAATVRALLDSASRTLASAARNRRK